MNDSKSIENIATGTSELSPLGQAALHYGEQCIAIFPCHNIIHGHCSCGNLRCDKPGKHPRTEHGHKDATPDLDRITELWQRSPNAHIGAPTGAVNQWGVLDVDPQHGGDRSLAALAAKHGPLPATRTVITGGGGYHFYFAHPGRGIWVPCSVGKIGPGLDVRADGGYVLLPPSGHISGRAYTFEDEGPVTQMPDWLLTLASTAARKGLPVDMAGVLAGVPEGERDDRLYRAICKLRGADVPFEWTTRLAVEAAANCQPPFSEDEARNKVERVYSQFEAANPAKNANTATHGGLARFGRVGTLRPWTTISLADVKPEVVRWVWRGRIPLGKLTALEGDPDLGKSTTSLDLGARVSTDREMPDGTRGDLAGPRGVVLLSAEDGLADTIRPRLEAAGADVSRIKALTMVVREFDHGDYEDLPTIADLDALRGAVTEINAALVIIDPLAAYMPPGVDGYRDQHVRRVLAPLAALAEELGIAIVVIRHLTKARDNTNPMYRGGGSIGTIAAVRSGLLIAKDRDDPTGQRRVLAVSKGNVTMKPPSIAYHLESAPGGVARVVWEGTVEATAESLLRAQEDTDEERAAQSALEDAKDILREILADGPMPSDGVKAEAKKAGITERTLWRAKGALGVKARKSGLKEGWTWTLPDGDIVNSASDLAKPAKKGEPSQPPGYGGVRDVGRLRERAGRRNGHDSLLDDNDVLDLTQVEVQPIE